MENEKNAINKVQSLRAEVETTKAEIEKATRNGDYAKAGQLQYGKLPDLQRQLEAEEKIAADKKEQSLLRDRVTAEEISRIVARWTGIPVEKLVEGEREKLLRLPEVLHQRVIGQDEAVQKVSDAILRSRAGICKPEPPHWQLFCFLGPHGRLARPSWPKRWPRPCLNDGKEHGSYRYDGIHGEIQCVSSDRCASGICGL